jgi:hypothetical protein
MNVYVDGVNRGSGTGPTGARTAPPTLRIGSIQTGTAAGFLNGTIDDVKLYDRVLSAGEVAALLLAPVPQSLTALPGDARVTLNWAASSGATNYYVKRSLVSGSGYTTIATNSSTTFTNTGLNNGTVYYFVVSALNGYGESANSVEVSTRPVSTTPTQITFALASNQIQLTWPLDHTGWKLQVQTNTLGTGLGNNWITLPTSAFTNQFTMPVDAANDSVFFRLIYP